MAKESEIHFSTTNLKFYGINKGSYYRTYNISIKDITHCSSPVSETKQRSRTTSYNSLFEIDEEEQEEFKQAYACM